MFLETPGGAFGAASTLVAQLGILLGMIVSGQPLLPLTVAAASSAISGSFGDSFSMYVSESTARRAPLQPALDVLFSKLAIGALFIVMYLIIGNKPPLLLLSSITISTALLAGLSYQISTLDSESFLTVFSRFTTLTIAVVSATTAFGIFLKKFI